MQRVEVKVQGREYPVYVGRSIYREVFKDILTGLRPGKVVVVSHPSIMKLHGEAIIKALEDVKRRQVGVPVFTFPEGEEGKNLRTLERGYLFLLKAGVNREDLLIAFGGGVVGDLGGYLASSYYRGIRYLQVPTTLMAMVDSSVGGKVGVDLPGAKNAVGAFYQPEAVICDVEMLRTLPSREYRSGLAEVAKYGFLFDQELLEILKGSTPDLLEMGVDPAFLVARCVEHKAGVVARDERDVSGERALLNYGHTFGHALESATAFRLLRHGEAVAAGMIMAAKASVGSGLARAGLVEEHGRVLNPLLEGVSLPRELDVFQVLENMTRDKKRGENLRFVLLKGLQRPCLVESLSEGVVRKAVEETLEEIKEIRREKWP